MKQAEFDTKVNAMSAKIDGLGPKLDSEAGEIAGIVAGYKDEIQRLKDSQGDNIDTSRLDELSNSLDAVGSRIGGLVDPLVPENTEPPAPAVPAETVDPQPPVAEEVQTPVEEVSAIPTEENQNESAEAESSEAAKADDEK